MRKRKAKRRAREHRAAWIAGRRPARGTWQLQDAKARFSELVRLVLSEGPQRVTVRGENPVVVVTEGEYQRLKSKGNKSIPLHEIFCPLAELDVTREPDYGRDIDLK